MCTLVSPQESLKCVILWVIPLKEVFKFSLALVITLKTKENSFHFLFLSSLLFSVNTHPPALQVNGSLLVPLGGFAPLPLTLLQVKDPDSPPERLIFQLVQGPSNGRLVLLRGEEGEERGGRGKAGRDLTRDDSFTWAELRTGRVRFRHQKDKARSVDLMCRKFREVDNVLNPPRSTQKLFKWACGDNVWC